MRKGTIYEDFNLHNPCLLFLCMIWDIMSIDHTYLLTKNDYKFAIANSI